jgi:hypothetical protein
MALKATEAKRAAAMRDPEGSVEQIRSIGSGGRAHLKALLLLGISRVVDVRDPIQRAYDPISTVPSLQTFYPAVDVSLSSETICRRCEIVPFEHLFFSLTAISPDVDDTVGFRRQRFDAVAIRSICAFVTMCSPNLPQAECNILLPHSAAVIGGQRMTIIVSTTSSG